MCLIAFGWQYWPGSRLLLVANRDEFHARPTAPAGWWGGASSGVLGGRDLQAGGGWLGVNRAGCMAALTNFREVPVTGKRSRGELVRRFLTGEQSAAESARQLHSERDEFAGFNLLLADARQLFYVSNRMAGPPQELSPGLYGLSNAVLNSPWPKTLKTTGLLGKAVNGQLDALLDIFADREQAADAELPITALPVEWEKMLSSPFITSPDYGTRATTVIDFSQSAEVSFVERQFNAGGETEATRHFRFRASQ